MVWKLKYTGDNAETLHILLGQLGDNSNQIINGFQAVASFQLERFEQYLHNARML